MDALQTIVTTIVGGVPAAEILKRVVLPSADALGERLKSRVERCFEKSAKMLDDAGSTVQAVPDKLVIEILQGASLEENENLHTMFASLLANAASVENAASVQSGFVAILKQMSPAEALLLKFIADREDKDQYGAGYYPEYHAAAPIPSVRQSLDIGLDGLVAAQLVKRTVILRGANRNSQSADIELADEGPFWLTDRGKAFMKCCTPPKPATVQ